MGVVGTHDFTSAGLSATRRKVHPNYSVLRITWPFDAPSYGCSSGVPWTDDCGRSAKNLSRCNRRAFPGARATDSGSWTGVPQDATGGEPRLRSCAPEFNELAKELAGEASWPVWPDSNFSCSRPVPTRSKGHQPASIATLTCPDLNQILRLCGLSTKSSPGLPDASDGCSPAGRE
jgi:hypothetical protein